MSDEGYFSGSDSEDYYGDEEDNEPDSDMRNGEKRKKRFRKRARMNHCSSCRKFLPKPDGPEGKKGKF
jgi:hypothetical protein